MIFRTLSDRTTARDVTNCFSCSACLEPGARGRGRAGREPVALGEGGRGDNTRVLPDVLESKRQVGILPLDDANLPERALSHDPQQPEMIKIDWTRAPQVSSQPRHKKKKLRSTREGSGKGNNGREPSSVKTTGFPLEFPIWQRTGSSSDGSSSRE